MAKLESPFLSRDYSSVGHRSSALPAELPASNRIVAFVTAEPTPPPYPQGCWSLEMHETQLELCSQPEDEMEVSMFRRGHPGA